MKSFLKIFFLIALLQVLFSCNQSDKNKSTNLEPINLETEKVNKAWFYNTQFGIGFETPSKLIEQEFNGVKGANEYVNEVYSYVMRNDEFIVNYMVLDTNFDTYAPDEGLKGAITNMVNITNGYDLELSYNEKFEKHVNKEAVGSFIISGNEMYVKGFAIFDKNKRVNLLIASGLKNEKVIEDINRVFESIKLINK